MLGVFSTLGPSGGAACYAHPMGGPEAEGSTVAVLAEKPSVARDIARVLGAAKQATAICTATGTWSPGPSATWPRWRSRMRSSPNGSSGGAICSPCCRANGRWSSTKKPKTSSRSCARS